MKAHLLIIPMLLAGSVIACKEPRVGTGNSTAFQTFIVECEERGGVVHSNATQALNSTILTVHCVEEDSFLPK